MINEITENSFPENNYFANNMVSLAGKITKHPELSHEIYGEKYYISEVAVNRLSSKADLIPITISERQFVTYCPTKGDYVKILGQYRSYNNYSGVGNRLILTVFVKSIGCLTEREFEEVNLSSNPNRIYLNGFICKKPTYRTTPSNREISDILLAVNRRYSNKSDYIPCIAWGTNAVYVSSLEVGTNLIIQGRIQSREYQKHISETETVNKTAYEVSVSQLEIVE